ncbi:MAG: MGMT family protein [Helicobacteraceae bacterium]|jgi:methylated-DNA-[protein]-cysteine S-methyltransferase|nr:MGMT family protein [Helicobacteraceae bacterium]
MPTPFQKEVYKALQKIPKGRVTTYGAIASYLNTKAIRAVGTAVGKNPNAPDIPCHRVVPSTGKVGNYSGVGGVNMKRTLLLEEGVAIENGKILHFEDTLYLFS